MTYLISPISSPILGSYNLALILWKEKYAKHVAVSSSIAMWKESISPFTNVAVTISDRKLKILYSKDISHSPML